MKSSLWWRSGRCEPDKARSDRGEQRQLAGAITPGLTQKCLAGVCDGVWRVATHEQQSQFLACELYSF